IQDDILDVIGDVEVIGKLTLSDQKNDKTTYVTFEGIDKAKAEVERLSTEAADIFASYSKEDNFLKELVLMLINREK
ncbi:MAG: polyprenyl synthetase family protein, partial [Lachnospiraceae bacterium]|nr:polyprenyl synthetase family protein [Lachnospiraceae bacterium]